jgi:hypothetical protein
MNEICFSQRKLSHDFGPTEIERFFNCHSFRSVSDFSLRAARQGLSFYVSLLDLQMRLGE